MNPEKPGHPFGWRTWLLSIGALTLVITAVLWMMPRNTRTVTFRFVDFVTGQPVTNVVLQPEHRRRSLFPDWVVRVFPALPQERCEELRLFCVSDKIAVSHIPANAGKDYDLRFLATGYHDAWFFPWLFPAMTNLVTVPLEAKRDW